MTTTFTTRWPKETARISIRPDAVDRRTEPAFVEPPGEVNAAEILEVAEEMAPRLAEAFVAALGWMGHGEEEEKLKQEAVNAAIARLSAKVESLGREVRSLRQHADSLRKRGEESAAKFASMDDRLRQHERVLLALQQQTRQLGLEGKSQQKLVGDHIRELTANVAHFDERLQVQGKALRNLQDMARGQVRRREELRTTLQKLRDMATGFSPSPLPENL